MLEAAASGLPVIARRDYEPESVIDGKTGFLAATDCELIERLAQLIASPDLCRTLGQAARRHVSSFSWDVIARQWETIFTRLAQLPPGVDCLIPKLVIVTEIIAPYRIPVFNALARRREIDLCVIFLSENDATLRQWRMYKDEIKFQYEVLPSWRQRFGRHNILLNRGVIPVLNQINPNAVLCGGYNYLASWQSAGWARVHRVPIALVREHGIGQATRPSSCGVHEETLLKPVPGLHCSWQIVVAVLQESDTR